MLASRATQKRKAVWLCSRDREGWACLHALRRHGIRPDELCVIEVEVEPDLVRGCRQQGLYYTPCNIPPECIQRVRGFVTCKL